MKKSEASNKALKASKASLTSSSSVSSTTSKFISSHKNSVRSSAKPVNKQNSADSESKVMNPSQANDETTSNLESKVKNKKFFEKLQHQITIDISMLQINSMEENNNPTTYSAFCALVYKIKSLLSFAPINDASSTANYLIALLGAHDFDSVEDAIKKLKY